MSLQARVEGTVGLYIRKRVVHFFLLIVLVDSYRRLVLNNYQTDYLCLALLIKYEISKI